MAASQQNPVDVRALRQKKGLTQPQLAVLADVPQSDISKIENRKTGPSADKIKSVGKALDMTNEKIDALVSQLSHKHHIHAYCPNPECPTMKSVATSSGRIYQPTFKLIPQGSPRWCPCCGEVLITHCPNPNCNRPLHVQTQLPTNFCEYCGQKLAYDMPEFPEGEQTSNHTK
ncbi:MAG: hypothetical protein CMJ19_18000 [Phycisphaeraceae bacterium]|nr:hypothetical protein [Phycisphaeraceae bacterium]